ncbi:poly(ADP-ribose) glycohydrolase 1 isoform X2 [Physcomitrium patens]|nr:poly(ADP-ribose) glycohydrolase 1-like isoform X2 [Physcomitrium patens]|eukprot:XP_024374113.1 poly(ADP-ribose) glycohydrolase 1-like isoform X2 [Physcomitrella patens]
MLFTLHSRGKDVGSCTELRPDMGLKLLRDQQRGIVVLSQRLVASLLACSFLCLYPSSERRQENLPHMNIDRLFAGIYERGESIEHKLLCLLHYFERVCQNMPEGVVSFERKVISLQNLKYSNTFWSSSTTSICPLTVVVDGSIEDLGQDCLQVDFANRLLGGGALGDGCVQEEIRFMINPELAAGMVFLPVMASNESIEIVGAERYCSYTGYASSFRFNGDFRDVMPRDAWGRRRTHVIAIDALSQPGDDQFRLPYRVRELTKAYCGFLNSARLRDNAVNWKPFRQSAKSKGRVVNESEDLVQSGDSQTSDFSIESPLIVDTRDECSKSVVIKPNDTTGTSGQFQDKDGDKMGAEIRDELGIATGNWGCGVFGGNLPLKCMLQWLAASQARRPYLLYFSFQNPDAQRLQEVADWILQEEWVVGELWSLVSEYASNNIFRVSLFDWILPLPETELGILQQSHVKRHGQREVVRHR